MTSALVVLSGGQDSTTVLFWAKERYKEIHAVTYDYGQRHRREIEAATTIANLANVSSHEIIKLPDGLLGGRSFLTDHTQPVEEFLTANDMDRSNAEKEDKLDSSFVPSRNTLFLAIALNRAFVLGCTSIITGITAADFAEYGQFSWEWLGGFIDAEGCFNQVNGSGYRLSFSQKDPELLHRITDWIKNEEPEFTNGFHFGVSGSEVTVGKKAISKIIDRLAPHLHSPLRRSQYERVSNQKLITEAPLTDAYITGFWEGDGSCTSREILIKKKYITHDFYLIFVQKYPEILEKISQYLGRGYVYQNQTNYQWYLMISDGPKSQKLLRRMKPHMNVLGSFKKIAEKRHAIGMSAGNFNPPYPDCTPDFLYAMQRVDDESLRTPFTEKIKIEAPLLYVTKAESVRLASNLPGAMEALAYSHTCYAGESPPCNKCHACLLRARGFEQAGVIDPLMLGELND